MRVPADETQPLRFWQAAVEFPRQEDGKRVRRMARSKDYNTAERLLAALRLQRAELAVRPPVPAEVPPPPPLIPSGSLAAWLRFWLAQMVAQEVRPRTAEHYQLMVRLHIEPAIGHKRLLEVGTADVRAVHEHMRAAGLSETTVLQGHRVLAIALKQAHREGYTHRDVAALVRPPRKSAPRTVTLSIDDARSIMTAANGVRLQSRWVAALTTGARQGELLGVEIDRVGTALDLSWQLQRFTWRHGCGGLCGFKRGAECPARVAPAPAGYERRHLTGALWLTRPKTAAGRRRIPLVEPLRSLVHERMDVASAESNPYGLLWTSDSSRTPGSPIDPGDDSKAWHRLLRRAGVSPAPLHHARHVAVDLLYEAGVPEVVAMELIGHSSVAMTRRYRSGASDQLLTSAMNAASSQLIPPTVVPRFTDDRR
jgi:integrase